MRRSDHAGSMKPRRETADRLAASGPRSSSPTTARFGSSAMWPSIAPRARCCDTARPGAFVAAAVPATSRSVTAPTLSRDVAIALQTARPHTGTPAVSLTTDDCDRAYQELRSRGVVFLSEPQTMDYGRVDAVFSDRGTWCNLPQDGPAGLPHASTSKQADEGERS
jgi:Glyoxalase/Bleomycin resistance protein/Dioxygenase superfamily